MHLPQRPDLYLDETDPQALIVTGTDLLASPDWFIGERKTIIRCCSLSLPETISWESGNLHIVTQRLVCHGNGSSIVVDGSAGEGFRSTDTAAPGASPGQNGSDGKDGKKGGDGGVIEIVALEIEGNLSLYARGGQGGGAQSGGHGAPGKNAVKPTCSSKGSAAGKGGNAGKAGTPGNAGDGGSIKIICKEVNGQSPITDVSPGQPGVPGKHGRVGDRGKGADGITCYYADFSRCSMPIY